MAVYLLIRYKRRRRARAAENEQADKGLDEFFGRQSKSSATPSADRGMDSYVEPPSAFEFTLPRQTSSFSKKIWPWSGNSVGKKDKNNSDSPAEKNIEGKSATNESKPRPSLGSRKTTLVYDPERPDEPPEFRSELQLEEEVLNIMGVTGPKVAVTLGSLGRQDSKDPNSDFDSVRPKFDGIGTAF